MSKRGVKNIILFIVFAVYIYAVMFKRCIFSSYSDYLKYSEIVNVSFLIVFLTITIWFLGFRKYKESFDSKNIIKSVLIYIFVTFVIMYGLGLAVGFLRNAYSRNLGTLFNNIFLPIVMIILVELIRYVILWANKDKKIFIYLFTILLILFELCINVRSLPGKDIEAIFNLFATIVLPIIMKNAVMSYLSYHIGYKVPIIYRLIMDIYLFIIPIIPNIGDYLNSMILLALPGVIYINAFSYIDDRTKEVEYFFENERFSLWDIPTVVLIVILAALISGFFPHYMIGVGSNSMHPAINKGDAVIMKKVTDKTKIKKGDIIAYTNDENGRVIIHRVQEVSKTNGKESYVTKGDANNSADTNVVFKSHVKGVVKVKIPYIAYPTVWISEYFSK